MGKAPQGEDITIGYDCQIEVRLKDSSLSTILAAFAELMGELLRDFIQKVLLGFAEEAMEQKKKPFACKKCGNEEEFKWKTRHGKPTQIHAFYGWVELQQLQVQCKRCGSKMNITRKLLGMEAKQRISAGIRQKLGLLGALMPYRVAEKVGGMFGWAVDKMTIWTAAQKTASEIEFTLDGDELPQGEADGTGIGIKGIAKQGKELKVFVQYKKGGGVRIAGLDIGNYNGSWDKLFKGSLGVFKKFRRKFLLITDGDTSILDALRDKVSVIVQRCLWHIPHQAKYVLWQDKVKHKSEEWLYVMSELLEICAIRSLVDCPDTIKAMIASKKKRLEAIIAHCGHKGHTHTLTYLQNAQPDMFTAIEKKLNGRTTSKVERVMRTVNMRADVGKWSEAGVLNVMKIRLAYYYNGFDA